MRQIAADVGSAAALEIHGRRRPPARFDPLRSQRWAEPTGHPLPVNNEMLVTVAICTWNRADLLDSALDEMCNMVIPSGVEWELLVVNNNCTDDTDEIIRKHQEDLPLRRLFEPAAGKSHALNRAVREAQGQWLLFTDDDAFVDGGWLAAYCEAIERWPECDFFGGPIEPRFEGSPPHWLAAEWKKLTSAYAVLDFGPEPFPLSEERLPFGVNMAVRTDRHRAYTYNTSLGPAPGSGRRGEETWLLEQMLRDGVQGRWVPTARVRHYIPRDRQTARYLRDYFFWFGKTEEMRARDQHRHQDLRSRFWMLRQALTNEVKYRVGRRFRRPSGWIRDLRESAYYWGRLMG